MRHLRRRLIAKSVGVIYKVRDDGVICLIYYDAVVGKTHLPYYPTFPTKVFLAKIRELDY